MASTLTTLGQTEISTALANGTPLVLTMRVGTGRRTVVPTVSSLQSEYQINNVVHAIPLAGAGLVLNDSNQVVGFRLRGFDANDMAAYSATEIGVFNAAGQLLAYTALEMGSQPIVKATTTTASFTLEFLVSITGSPTITIQTTITGVSTATTTLQGTVQLAADGDTTSTGAVVVNPAQAAAIAAAAVPTLTYATAAQINTGTVTDRPIAPDQLEASAYRRLFTRASGSTTIPSGAKAGDWIGTEE